MRSIKLMLCAGVLVVAVACGDTANNTADGKDTTSTVASTGDDAASPATNDATATSADVNVPSATRTSFETKYPNASNVKWSRYKPVDKTTVDKDDWRYNLDSNDYEVSFNWDGLDYYAWYNDGNWLRASTNITDYSKLPAAVNNLIKNQYAGYEITEADKEHDNDRTLYEIDLKKGDDKLKLHVDENGKIVKKKGKEDGMKVKVKEDKKQ